MLFEDHCLGLPGLQNRQSQSIMRRSSNHKRVSLTELPNKRTSRSEELKSIRESRKIKRNTRVVPDGRTSIREDVLLD